MDGPNRGPVLAIAILFPFVVVRLAVVAQRERIDGKLIELLSGGIRHYKVVAEDFPLYRFVDVFRAIEGELGESNVEVLDSTHVEGLGAILNGAFGGIGAGFPHEPLRVPRAVDPKHDDYLPKERFWIRKQVQGGRPPVIVRIRDIEYPEVVRLEVASRDVGEAQQLVSAIRERSVSASIYRGKSIEVSFARGVKDELGNVDHFGKVKVDFRRTPVVGRDDIVLDPRVWPIVEHTLLGLHRHRAELEECGVALKRGVLFYGPPGTGKSFTCRYLASLLDETTVIHCAGSALHHVASIFNLARMLKPSLVILEDVDLVFSAREINVDAGALGELFDRIDALDDREPILMVMTTNAIERVEIAVRNRPGRVSQCIYFGPPSPELRRRYLLSFLKEHDVGRLNLELLVQETEGATQVFLKELVQRALQFTVEAGRRDGSRAEPSTEDFVAALAEIRAFDGKAVRNVTGFRVEAG